MNKKETIKVDAEIAAIIALAKKQGIATEKQANQNLLYLIITTVISTLAILYLAKIFV
jgi:hypothetical protein